MAKARRSARRWGLAVAGALLATAAPGLVSAAPALDSIHAPGATVSAVAVRVDPPKNGPAAGEHFATLPPGSVLPSDTACAAAVRPEAERRPANAAANAALGIGVTDGQPRVSGNYSGTTGEIIQWVACKWGIDEDVVRAQVAKESWWHQDAKGDQTGDQSKCHPLLRTSTATCPESIGLGQVRYQYHLAAFANDNAIRSSAYNLDYTYAVWRSCFEGELTWLNTVERGSQYAAGDMWGCLGVWFSGRWHTSAADGYIVAVQGYLAQRIWETPDFQGG